MHITIQEIIDLLLYILPAYVANGAPVIFGGGKPLDFGKNFIDGKRIFGNNKTIRGFISGILSGTLIGVFLLPLYKFNILQIYRAFILSIGAHFGDLFGSFVKRRLDIKSGESAPLLDQLGFLYFALLFAYLFCGDTISLIELFILTLITLILHPLTNLGAFLLTIKEKPY